MNGHDGRRFLGRAATIVAGLALSACASTEADQAHEALRLWEREGPASYVYVSNGYRRDEREPFLDTERYDHAEWRVVVENREVVSVSDQPTGHPLSETPLTMDGLLKRVIFYMEDGGYEPDDYEASYDERWGYVKHFKAGVDSFTFLDVSCFEASTSNDACRFGEVDEDACLQEPVAASAKPFDQVAHGGAAECGRGQIFTRVRDTELMCCHSRY
jgi:hypothetical protein